LDWVRRGSCKPCHQTFTFLPPFSRPYTHYSLIEQSPRLLNETFNWEKDNASVTTAGGSATQRIGRLNREETEEIVDERALGAD
jgi:hypothetical protein